MILARMDDAPPKAMDAAREWAMSAGVSDGSNPKGQLTREQLVTMLYRYCEGRGYDVSASGSLSGFSYAGNVSNYAVDALCWAVSGSTVTGIVPQGSATCAKMAVILQRVYAKQ